MPTKRKAGAKRAAVKKTAKPTPATVAADTLKLVRSKTNKKRAASYQRYFKEPVDFYGLDNATSQQVIADVYARVKDHWTIRDAVRFANEMVKDPYMEPRGIAYQTVARFVPEAPPTLVKDVKRWLAKTSGNWALVDGLASSVLGPLVDRHPELVPEVISWTDSPNQWVRRGAVVAFVPLVRRKKKHLAAAYRLASRLFDDDEDLMHKAVGWLLREAGKVDSDRLRTYLLRHGPKIPRTTVRYAIERFPKEERKKLLAATKG